MLDEIVPVSFDKIMQTGSYTLISLKADGMRFAIYCDPAVGQFLQLKLSGGESLRPMTADLLRAVLMGLDARIKQVVITELHDTIYHARVFLEQQMGEQLRIVEVDARPSDAITLALLDHIPLFVTREVLEQTLPLEELP